MNTIQTWFLLKKNIRLQLKMNILITVLMIVLIAVVIYYYIFFYKRNFFFIGKHTDNETDSNISSFLSSCRSSNFWLKTIPTIESINKQLQEYAKPTNDPTKSIILPIRERNVLLLPYCDIGAPDFLEYNYPDKEKFLAGPENYRR